MGCFKYDSTPSIQDTNIKRANNNVIALHTCVVNLDTLDLLYLSDFDSKIICLTGVISL